MAVGRIILQIKQVSAYRSERVYVFEGVRQIRQGCSPLNGNGWSGDGRV